MTVQVQAHLALRALQVRPYQAAQALLLKKIALTIVEWEAASTEVLNRRTVHPQLKATSTLDKGRDPDENIKANMLKLK